MIQSNYNFVSGPKNKKQLEDADSSQTRFLITGAALLSLFAFIGCSKGTSSTASIFAADNSGQNATQGNNRALTSEDQKENEADLKTTQKIRQLIVDSSELSINGQNVKVITSNGMVTLKGPVKDQSEVNIIVAKAKQIAGDDKVINQLEFNTNQNN